MAALVETWLDYYNLTQHVNAYYLVEPHNNVLIIFRQGVGLLKSCDGNYYLIFKGTHSIIDKNVVGEVLKELLNEKN